MRSCPPSPLLFLILIRTRTPFRFGVKVLMKRRHLYASPPTGHRRTVQRTPAVQTQLVRAQYTWWRLAPLAHGGLAHASPAENGARGLALYGSVTGDDGLAQPPSRGSRPPSGREGEPRLLGDGREFVQAVRTERSVRSIRQNLTYGDSLVLRRQL